MSVLNMRQMKEVAKAVFAGGFPLLIRGRHGIGKSEFVYQIAKEAGSIIGCDEREEFPVIEMRASQMTEGDLTGLPYRGPEINGQTSTKFNPPDWYLRGCAEPVILFFDEVDRGIPEVRQGIFQINDSRQLNGHKLHPHSRVVACINGGIHGANYQVGDFDPAELDRYQVYDLEPDPEEWATYCRSIGVMPEIINFCLERPKFLEVTDSMAHDPSKVTPSRRSWVRLDRTLQKLPMFSDGITDENSTMLFMIAGGYIGEEASSAFRNYALEYERTVDPEKVIFENQLDKLDKMTVGDFAEFAMEFVDSEILAKDPETLTEQHYSNIRQCIMKFPTEIMMVWWQALCVSGKFDVKNIEKLGWDFDNEETEEEQVEFTRILVETMIEPPEDVDLEGMIKKVQDNYNSSKEEETEDK